MYSPEGWPIQGIPFGWKYYLASTLFSSCYRYARRDSIRDTTLTDKEHSQMLITTELQQSVQSIALLSGNWNLLSVFCQQLSYFFYSYAFLRLSYIYIYNTIEFKSNFILIHITFFGSLLMAQGIWGRHSLNTFNWIANADLWRVNSFTLVIIFTLISFHTLKF